MTPSTARDRRQVALLLALASLTGLVDATSFLGLGRVFVANMTGNVVLLAFALAGAPGLSADLSALALAGFLTGAVLAGRAGTAPALRRGRGARWLTVALAIQTGLIIAALIAASLTSEGRADRPYGIIAPLAAAMGLQHATARRVAVPEVPTNVLTTTLTGLVIDSRLAGGPGFHAPRRLAAPLAMFTGALVGSALLLHVDRVVPLALAAAIAAGCLTAAATGRLTAP
ncbi:putative membrane protein [Frankia torreyi]|uniref:Putative membrane protein n=1 Tax=Frankia torreyi TaxID=1856 RepID=A0A0D8B8F7_9ACTN|nr:MULTISPECIES: YoaK family protein [Frankia]KJE20471.1 putative membrane protein [Frankia torreyi]KQM02972.1 putative membrane protein [Frankia sp. CpI1-P]